MCSKLILVSLLIASANLARAIDCDGNEIASSTTNKTNAICDETSTEGADPWNMVRTTFNNTLLLDMGKRATGMNTTRPGQVPMKITVPSGAQCVNQLDDGAVTYGIRVDPDAGACGNAVNGLYDKQGNIVGIQIHIPLNESSGLTPNNYNYSKTGVFNKETINGRQFYVVTAYFVDPAIICTTGRSSPVNGVGDSLAFQNGKTPASLLKAPKRRCNAKAQGWSQNNCFVGMGYHNFNNVSKWAETSCTELVPFFLLFNDNGYLTGFGFDFVGLSKNCRFEQPPISAIKLIVGDSMPQCLEDYSKSPGVTTMHVFFTEKDPTCPITGAIEDALCKIKRWWSG